MNRNVHHLGRLASSLYKSVLTIVFLVGCFSSLQARVDNKNDVISLSVLTNDEITYREIISVFNTINVISPFQVYDFENDRPNIVIMSGKDAIFDSVISKSVFPEGFPEPLKQDYLKLKLQGNACSIHRLTNGFGEDFVLAVSNYLEDSDDHIRCSMAGVIFFKSRSLEQTESEMSKPLLELFQVFLEVTVGYGKDGE